MRETPINFRVLILTSSPLSRLFGPARIPTHLQAERCSRVVRREQPYYGIMHRRLNLRVTAAVVALLLVASSCGDGTDDSTPPQDPTSTTTEATSPTTEGSSPATTTDDSVAVAWPHDWTEKTVGGGQFDAGDYAGQDLVLWFWAPW